MPRGDIYMRVAYPARRRLPTQLSDNARLRRKVALPGTRHAATARPARSGICIINYCELTAHSHRRGAARRGGDAFSLAPRQNAVIRSFLRFRGSNADEPIVAEATKRDI